MTNKYRNKFMFAIRETVFFGNVEQYLWYIANYLPIFVSSYVRRILYDLNYLYEIFYRVLRNIRYYANSTNDPMEDFEVDSS